MKCKESFNVKNKATKDEIVCALTEEGCIVKVTKNYIDNNLESYQIWILEV